MKKKHNIENLKPFKKGQSGNPNGRPKKLPHLDELLSDVLGDEKDGITAAEVILMKLRKMAINGNVRAIEILLDRAYGKAIQKNELTLNDLPDSYQAFLERIINEDAK